MLHTAPSSSTPGHMQQVKAPVLAGAVQFLFKLSDGRKYIHCGDMRFGEHLMGNKHLQRFVGADGVFLDTTYCKAKHQFPPQVLNKSDCPKEGRIGLIWQHLGGAQDYFSWQLASACLPRVALQAFP